MPDAAGASSRAARCRRPGRGCQADRTPRGDDRIILKLQSQALDDIADAGFACAIGVAFGRSLYQRWRGLELLRGLAAWLAGSANVRLCKRATENGRWPGASERRYRH